MQPITDIGPDGQRLRSLQDELEDDYKAMDRAAEARRALASDVASQRAFVGGVRSLGHQGVLAQYAADDGAEDLDRRRCVAELDRYLQRGGSFVDLARRLEEEAPGLRSQRYTMERQQRQRAEAQAVRQVQGSELDQLRQEVTHLRSMLAARESRGW